MEELNFLGDSWHLDLFFLWLSLVAGHSSGPLWVCLVLLVGFLSLGEFLLVLWASWLAYAFGVSSWVRRNLVGLLFVFFGWILPRIFPLLS